MENQDKNLISRREAIKKAAMVFGGVLTTPAALTILQGCSPNVRAQTTSFTDVERATIDAIADIIIPTTDTPGATEAGAVQLLEDILFAVNSEEDRNDFLSKLEGFMEDAEQEFGTSFSEATSEQQIEFVTKLHNEAFAQEIGWDDPKPFMWQMKEGIVYTYFGTEVGMTQVHQYIQVPGRYDPCVPFSDAGEGNKVWAANW